MRFNIGFAANKRVPLCIYFILAMAGLFFCKALLADDEIIHVIKSGETIYGLAREYGVKVEEILFINGIDDARRIQSGQRIRIPATPSMVPPINPDPNAPAVVLYRAQKGDTLFGIAQRNNISVDGLLGLNNLTGSYVLKAGDVLKLPVTATVAVKPAEPVIRESQPRTPTAASETVKTPGPYVDLSLTWPIKPKQGAYMTGKLSGVALVGEQGESVFCVYPGTVLSAMPYRGFGRVVIVKSAEGYLYVYGGCERLLVKAGDFVTKGMELGRLGIDSMSGQAALFFMVYYNSNPVDPAMAPRG